MSQSHLPFYGSTNSPVTPHSTRHSKQDHNRNNRNDLEIGAESAEETEPLLPIAAASCTSSNYGDSEPGLNPRYVDVELHEDVLIQTVDFNGQTPSQFQVFSNSSLEAYLEEERSPQSKVRWIHCTGISWDVLRLLALKYDLHPLAVEDIVHSANHSQRSKNEYFGSQLFISLAMHQLDTNNSTYPPTHSNSNSMPRIIRKLQTPPPGSSQSQESVPNLYPHNLYKQNLKAALKEIDLKEENLISRNPNKLSSSSFGRRDYGRDEKRKARSRAAEFTVSKLTESVDIQVSQLSIFLLRDGTVISFIAGPFQQRFSAIFDRISVNGLLKRSEDPSMLLQALLDGVADAVMGIVEEFREEITILESKSLSSPSISTIRKLHSISAQLLLLKSNISPLQGLIQSLRYADSIKSLGASKIEGIGEKKGFITAQTKIYLSDVLDHLDASLASLELFSSLSENLLNFNFNDLSFSSSNSMKALSVISIIFLPLSFLSGFFGMNFARFPAIEGDVSYFWKIFAKIFSRRIAIPITLITLAIFANEYIRGGISSTRRELQRMYHVRIFESRSGKLHLD